MNSRSIKINYFVVLFLVTFYHSFAQTIRINEVVSSNSVYTDEGGDTSDWLEIHNFGNQEVSIKAWSLSNDANNLTKWTFPNSTLSPHEYMLIWASSKNRTVINYPKTLVNQGDEFKFLIPISEPNPAWKTLNFEDSSWSSGNSGFGYNDEDDATRIPIGTKSIYLRKKFTVGNLSNISSLILDVDYDDAFVAYINGKEIARANINGNPPAFNASSITFREAEMYSGGKPERFTITDLNLILTEGENILTIQAHNFGLNSSDFSIIPFLSAIFLTPTNIGTTPPAILGLTENKLHTNFEISSSSETLFLTNASGTIVNQITAENLSQNTSIGISIASGEVVSYLEPTPGSENSTQEYSGNIKSEVIFSQPGSTINAPISLTLSGNTATEIIRYTINGTDPTASSTMYTNPIQINESTTVKAQIFSENYIPSAVFTSSYILDPNSLIFTDSNLPIVLIETENGATVLDDPRIFGSMKIIERPNGARNFVTDANNEDFLDYSGTISIEIRGSSSQLLPKKPYGLTTLSNDRTENDNVKLLGMPKENDWILNSFAYDDSMMRDFISYEMARKMGQYAVNLKYCEVVINGDYKGLYVLSEKIKIDGDRVDLAKLDEDENIFPEVTGGYIIQTDRTSTKDPAAWFANNAVYIHEKPNSEDITQIQSNYIESIFRNLDETANNSNISNGFPSVINVPSFVDYMLMAEIASNVDTYALSTFYHKDRGGKLRAGPIWDYNLTYGNDLFDWGFDRSFTNVWQFKHSNIGANFWTDLFNNTTFKCYLAKRFEEVTKTGEPLNHDSISNLIDDTAALISEAVVRENIRWNTINDFTREISHIKNWLQARITWMKNNLGSFSDCNTVTRPNLVITKIDYNPQESSAFPESDDLEFIEIKNIGNSTINLTGIYLAKLGISYQFPTNSTIEAKKSIQLASNATVFQTKYGFAPFDVFQRDLSNKSHHLVLANAFGNIIDEVEYFDKSPWPETADGDGFYLELIDENTDNNIASHWKSSTNRILNVDNFETNTVNFRVFPNPTLAILKIVSEQKIASIQFFNVLGQKVKLFQTNFNSGEINISELKKGTYFVKLKFINGNQSTITVMKQ
ncbi:MULTISPECIES: CotH kinase family protein [unclassified Polaribacter]|uniref:CotH kinase family protein n=1 Tax=unclassified Polaribacter TaxID=196858 RepID=UPI0011BF048F|nr:MULTISPECIES: CotH kinase family protein [unclassified Polaribacter]TXD48973.1 T9SS type A sorting domain-containing protein [Polaribacter sp. IC063]TXD55913.1 T9SS type A sorting domain-containing protein [Polaribacter sp. IC066]